MSALEAEHVVWDLSDLLHGRDDEAAVGELLDEADALADDLAARRGQVASWDAGALAAFMQDQAHLYDVTGRAGSWASLRFAADVNDPTRGAPEQQASARGPARRCPRRADAGPPHRGLRLQQAAAREAGGGPAAQVPEVDIEPQPRQRSERRVGAGVGRRREASLRRPPALVPVEGEGSRR